MNRARSITVAAGMCGVVALNILLLPRRYGLRVTSEIIHRAPMDLIVATSGTVEAKASVTLKTPFQGPIVRKQFHEGQTVRKDDFLVEFGRDKIRLDHQTKVDALKNARSDLSKARKDVRLQEALYQRQAVAYSSVEDARRAVVKAEQDLRTAEEACRLDDERWNAYRVTAPFTGTIVKDSLGDDPGVDADKELLTLADVSEFTVQARVDELDLKQVQIGQRADVRIPSYAGVVFPAVVSRIGSQAEGSGVADVPVALKITDTHGVLLRPRLTAQVRILTGKTEPVFSVPGASVTNSDGQSRVWMIDRFHRLRSRQIQTGRASPDRVEITQGLTDGETVSAQMPTPDFAPGRAVQVVPARDVFSEGR